MNWIDVPDSSTIARFRYDDQSQTLAVEFKNGGRYEYFDVPTAVYEGMRSAPSKGQYLAQTIKNNYRYART